MYSSSPRRQNVSSLQTYKIIFEFGPPQLNLFRYITKKVGILWNEAKEKCSLKDGGKPTNGLLLVCEDDERTVNDCLKIVGFDVYQLERLLESWFPLLKKLKHCLHCFYFKYVNYKKKIQTGFELTSIIFRNPFLGLTIMEILTDKTYIRKRICSPLW